MTLNTSVYIDILDQGMKIALLEKLKVNNIKTSESVNRFKIGNSKYGIIEVDKPSMVAELFAKHPDRTLIILTPEIDYSSSFNNQIKTPSKLSIIYERLISCLKVRVTEEKKPDTFSFEDKIPSTHDTEYVLERVFVNKTRRYIRTKLHKEIMLTDDEFKLFMELSDKGSITDKDAITLLYGHCDFFPSPMSVHVSSLWKRIRTLKFLVIEYDKKTIKLRFRKDYQEKLPAAQKFDPSFQRSYPS